MNTLLNKDKPLSEANTGTRICSAALNCLKRLGFERCTMSDIAREANIARPTLYKYFKNKDQVFFTAIDNEAFIFANTVIEHAKSFGSIEERITETIIFVVRELPRTPYLSLVLNDEMAGVLRDRAFSDEATLIFSEMTAGPLIEINPDLNDQGIEISEIMSRFAISLILFPGKYSQDDESLRTLIHRRILPGLIHELID